MAHEAAKALDLMADTAAGRPAFLHRRLRGDDRTLDCLQEPEGLLRWFGRKGTLPDAAPALDPGQTEARDVAGAWLLTGMAAAGTGDSPEPDFLAGRNCLLAFCFAETVRTILDWIAYHALVHGATGAVIINRAPPDPAFAAELTQELAARTDTGSLDFHLILLDSPAPLGRPDDYPETHPIHAPDAPGKDRMERPAPDAWLAPLGEPLVYEAAKWRFLRQARAVLAVDCCDLVCPPEEGAPGVFDLCAAARGGVVLLAGHRIYPWRVRPGREALFGDHVCRQFDARRGIAKWGVAPEKAGLDKIWRGIRVSYARPDPGTVIRFWRAMALKVPGQKASVLAPKTSLIEDPALVDLAISRFGAKPVRPPISTVAEAAPSDGRTVIITTMKNEGPFILEWIAYHRAIGVDDFLIYTNDCTDGTDALLDVLAARGLVVHRPNPFRQMPGLKPQHAALQAAEDEAVVRNSAWVICMDVDEFIDIRLSDGRLQTLYAAMSGANMIALTWRMFGNADVTGFEDRFIIEQFTRAATEMTRKPHQAWGFKTLFRNIALYKKLGVHRPKGLRADLWDQVRWLNGSGQPMPRDVIRNGWRSSTDSFGYDWVGLNHYACRSAESFLVKRDRGRVNHVDRDQGLNYWFRMNHNAVEERSILGRLPLLQAEFARLLDDPAIRAAHGACVAAHRKRIAELMADPPGAALYAELTGERMQALSRLLKHFGASVFNAGPAVIPPDLHRQPLADDFLFTVDHDGNAEH